MRSQQEFGGRGSLRIMLIARLIAHATSDQIKYPFAHTKCDNFSSNSRSEYIARFSLEFSCELSNKSFVEYAAL